jgi:hypothetical protein
MFTPNTLTWRQFWAIHLLVALSLLALWGWIETGNRYLILAAAAAFYGSLCFAFAGLYQRLARRSP